MTSLQIFDGKTTPGMAQLQGLSVVSRTVLSVLIARMLCSHRFCEHWHTSLDLEIIGSNNLITLSMGLKHQT